jgi:predicted methyltransferase
VAVAEAETPAEPAAQAPSPPDLPQTDATTREAIAAALAANHRDPPARARDSWRHPAETLEFFGLRRDMTVIELWPGGGWYTNILAPVLAEEGKLVVTGHDPAGPKDYYGTQQAQAMIARLKDTKTYGEVDIRTVRPPEDVNLGPDNSADMVLTFRNSHGWVRRGQEDLIYGEAFRVLKPGGVLGVVQHRAGPGVTDVRKTAETGYVPEDYLVEKIESVGFRLVDKSDINANPKDTKDHPKGVWTLPPSYELEDKDREKYQAIGESDRMTLRFVKPAQ